MDEAVVKTRRGDIRIVSDDPSFSLDRRLVQQLAARLQDADPDDAFDVATRINRLLPPTLAAEVVTEPQHDFTIATAHIRARSG